MRVQFLPLACATVLAVSVAGADEPQRPDRVAAASAVEAAEQWVQMLKERKWSDAFCRMTPQASDKLAVSVTALAFIPTAGQTEKEVVKKHADVEKLEPLIRKMMQSREPSLEAINEAMQHIRNPPELFGEMCELMKSREMENWMNQLSDPKAKINVTAGPGRQIMRNGPKYDAVGEVRIDLPNGSGVEHFGLTETAEGWLVAY